MLWYVVVAVVVALSATPARSAPLPREGGGSNPKNPDDTRSTAPSATGLFDPIAAALSSRLAQISLEVGRLPVLSLPSVLVQLKTPRVKVVVPFRVFTNAKAAKPPQSRRAVEERAVNPKWPKPTSTTRTTRVFGSSSVPVKVPVASSPPPDNPKHVFAPTPVVKVVSYTFAMPGGGATTVIEAQGSWSHPGRPEQTRTRT
ncbi:uncharacterized protein RHOBADRAFT_54594 [Rhodotorula graminis WP1]|uniref:Uncharacterized protein n=1 Tax=Rhodotorula graminis (strain WP1) TaxID=578459 RepID=A0A0P9FE25_RHOGW|nr:uncharacterized protein RHOBADRAFT_54594 [Rhodotorula graminis WP1]KPV74023.1 hypothetical protein RHOBADRAFT_54594 [Rhodotorula graminis WP1]